MQKPNYANYETKMVRDEGIKFIGWPLEKFGSPSDINTIGELRRLRDALNSGACRLVKLTENERLAHAKDMEDRQNTGEVIGKKRKTRSDAGTARGKRKSSGTKDTPTKKKKGIQGKATISPETVPESSDIGSSSDED